MENPKFEHDCDQCIFLGHYQDHDLYYCDQISMPTVSARWGDTGSDYISGLSFAEPFLNVVTNEMTYIPAMIEAKKRAIQKGLL